MKQSEVTGKELFEIHRLQVGRLSIDKQECTFNLQKTKKMRDHFTKYPL